MQNWVLRFRGHRFSVHLFWAIHNFGSAADQDRLASVLSRSGLVFKDDNSHHDAMERYTLPVRRYLEVASKKGFMVVTQTPERYFTFKYVIVPTYDPFQLP